jgi:hypothetical protein
VGQFEFVASEKLESHFGRALFARSSLLAALILAIWTNFSWAPVEVSHASPGLERHSGQTSVSGLIGRNSGISVFFAMQ